LEEAEEALSDISVKLKTPHPAVALCDAVFLAK